MSLKEIFRKNKGILGINERNVGHIYPENPRKLLKLVDDKLTTKKLLKSANIPFPEVYGVFRAV